MKEEEHLLVAYDYNHEFPFCNKLNERALLRSIDAWFLHIGEALKSKAHRLLE